MEPPPRQKAPKTRIVDLGDLTREFPPGTLVDRYEIVATLGSGGCGVVYSARHIHLNQTVALKLLHRNLINSEERVERFYREARASAAVGNPHVVRVSDCGVTAEGVPFLAMEFLKGVVLENLLDGSDGLPLDQAIDIGLQVLDGLGAAHDAGVIHRDLKPENIFLIPDPETGKDFVKILDFGVSKMVTGTSEKVLTSTGALLGTPRYMAPEQFRGARNVDHRADLFAASVVLFQMLSGKLPFEGDNPLVLAHRAATQPPRPLHEFIPELPDDVCGVIYQGLAKDPEERWQNARAFAEALRTAYLNSTSSIEIDVSDDDSTDISQADRPTDVTDDEPSSEPRDTFRAHIDPELLLDGTTIPSSAGIPAPRYTPNIKDLFEEDPDDPTLPTGTMSFGDKAAAHVAVLSEPEAGNDSREASDVSEPAIEKESGPDPALDITPKTPPPAFAESRRALVDPALDVTPATPPPAMDARQEARPNRLTDGDESESTLPWGRRPQNASPQPPVDPLAETSEAESARAESQRHPVPSSLSSRPVHESVEPGPAIVQPMAPVPPPQTPNVDVSAAPSPSESSSSVVAIGPTPMSPATGSSSFWKVLMVLFAILSLIGGIVLGYVLLATGWFDSPQSVETPSEPSPSNRQGVEFANIEIDGSLDEEAIRTALTSVRPDMEMCRRPERAQIVLEAHITPASFGENRVSQVRSLPADEEPSDVAQCCINAFRNGIPAGWNPGDSGVLTFEITLPER